MQNVIHTISKAFHIVAYRLKAQGLRTTLLWVYARGLPRLTGIPILKYSQISPQVYVGAQYSAQGKRTLQLWGINGIINMRQEFDDAANGLELEYYLHLPTVDDEAPSMQALEQGSQFIHRVVSQGGKVYIHCAGGVGRAPTMAAAFFIQHQGKSLAETLALIQKARPFINITPAQMQRLKEWNQKYHAAISSNSA